MSARGTRYRTAAGTPRRRPRVRRASSRLSPTRAAAALVMLAAGGAIYGLAGTPALGFERLDITGAVLTPMDQVRQGVGLTPGTNLVALDTRPIVDRLRTLPTVDSVSVAVRLPDSLQVAIAERTPVVLWQIGSQRYAVDDTGTLFAAVGADAPPAVAAVPVVADQRAASQGLA
ncbi:MAG TPA: FtsQ-type POTRA domain-containing protein, partial [Candidatus Limnocylindrales bacterium]|nr:FtsQ-type POTRA domain-containing protein [Candidatus Limnocylindrales bacterium]